MSDTARLEAITVIIETTNHGQWIVASTFWCSPYERAGKLFVSVNAGAVRILVPSVHRSLIEECRSCKHVVLSRGPWPDEGKADAVEFLFEDGSQSPFSIHLVAESFDLLPGEPEPGREWVCSLWIWKKNKPHKSLERLCHWRRVERIPCLLPWEPK